MHLKYICWVDVERGMDLFSYVYEFPERSLNYKDLRARFIPGEPHSTLGLMRNLPHGGTLPPSVKVSAKNTTMHNCFSGSSSK